MIKYWLETAEEDLIAAGDLFKSGRNTHSLFWAHLALERLLKALVLKNTGQSPYPTHDLLILSKQANLQLTDDLRLKLAEVNQFNLRARYEDYKREFYKKATAEYTTKWIKEVKETCTWLKKQF